LREAGVVDAGGFGLTVLLGGMVAALRGSEPPPRVQSQSPTPVADPRHVSITYRYCTNFAVTGSGLEPRRFVAELDRLGDSVLVVGDAQTLRVHVHTDRPDAAATVFEDAGEVSHVDVFDMRERLGGADSTSPR
jgi:dihydroxyacetone kinase-like predicted kinase